LKYIVETKGRRLGFGHNGFTLTEIDNEPSMISSLCYSIT
jgi:hypothetical protein